MNRDQIIIQEFKHQIKHHKEVTLKYKQFKHYKKEIKI